MAPPKATRTTVGEVTRLHRQMVTAAERLREQVAKLAAASEAFSAAMNKLQSKFLDVAVEFPSLSPQARDEVLLMARAVPLRDGLVELLESVHNNGTPSVHNDGTEPSSDNLTPWSPSSPES